MSTCSREAALTSESRSPWWLHVKGTGARPSLRDSPAPGGLPTVPPRFPGPCSPQLLDGPPARASHPLPALSSVVPPEGSPSAFPALSDLGRHWSLASQAQTPLRACSPIPGCLSVWRSWLCSGHTGLRVSVVGSLGCCCVLAGRQLPGECASLISPLSSPNSIGPPRLGSVSFRSCPTGRP